MPRKKGLFLYSIRQNKTYNQKDTKSDFFAASNTQNRVPPLWRAHVARPPSGENFFYRAC
jgi:hypothetical protein